jgi:excisionase family DNA binding protein
VNVQASPLLTVAQAAERLAVSEKSVRRLIAAGKIPAVKIGGSVRVDPARARELRLRGRGVSRYLLVDGAGEREISPRLAQQITSGGIRFNGFEVFCAGCSGAGCHLCEPKPIPRPSLLKRLLGRG